jgi:hypothetical protein
MSSDARIQPDPLERLRSALLDRSWSYDFLDTYVSYVDENRHEEEVFCLLALNSEDPGPAAAGGFAGRNLRDSYEAMSSIERLDLRQSWHERARREAFRHDELRTRLSWRYYV